MSTTITSTRDSVNDRRCEELAEGEFLVLTGFNVQRIIFELIKNYLISNTPEEAGVNLAQRYNVDPTKSGIFLDVGYNWKAQLTDKFPAVYVQRGDIDINSPTLGQSTTYDAQESEDSRICINRMPVIISCIAAAPVAVVENLAEYVTQPLLCFRREVKNDFKMRELKLVKVSKPAITNESKNNFVIDLVVDTVFDSSWIIQKEDLKLKTIGLSLFNDLVSCPSCG